MIGNDYTTFAIQQQMELMLALRTGSFPLFVPTLYGGLTASALTLGQLHHPIAHLAVRLPGYGQGRALDWNTVLRLVSLGIAHASLTVEFRYASRSASWGMALSCLTGSGLAVFFGLRAPRRSLRIAGLAAAVLIAGAGWAWRQSLYRGHGFGTVYTWSR